MSNKMKQQIEEKEKEKVDIEHLLQKQHKQRLILYSIACVVLITIIVLAINSAILSSRKIYGSVKEMRNDLVGTWIYRYSNSPIAGIEIEETKLTEHIYSNDRGITYTITWNPSRGTFKTNRGTYIVKKNNNSSYYIEFNKCEYSKGSLTVLGKDPESSSYKSDIKKSWSAAYDYINLLEAKQKSINYIDLSSTPSNVRGNLIQFDCKVSTTAGVRFGVINVVNNNGEYTVTGLNYTD